MTIEEKAKAYDEALERAKDYYKANQKIGESDENEVLSDIFPELAESEDEKIKNAIITTIHLYYGEPLEDEAKEMIAWLEKQCQQKPIVDGILTANNYDKWFQNCKVPKFKVGDWIVQEKIGVYKVIEVCESWYEVVDNKNKHYSISFELEYMCHLWTIQAAKDGDVLVNGSNIFIFSYLSDTRAMGYCHINLDDGRFYDDKDKTECFGLIDADFSPATKEQRDLLFKKMKETGYEWDENKKELRKIEQKSKWSNEDEERLQSCIIALQGNGLMGGVDTMDSKWLKSLKQRMEE